MPLFGLGVTAEIEVLATVTNKTGGIAQPPPAHVAVPLPAVNPLPPETIVGFAKIPPGTKSCGALVVSSVQCNPSVDLSKHIAMKFELATPAVQSAAHAQKNPPDWNWLCTMGFVSPPDAQDSAGLPAVIGLPEKLDH